MNGTSPLPASPPAPAVCGACGRAVTKNTASIAFKTYHDACIRRAIEAAKGDDD